MKFMLYTCVCFRGPTDRERLAALCEGWDADRRKGVYIRLQAQQRAIRVAGQLQQVTTALQYEVTNQHSPLVHCSEVRPISGGVTSRLD